LVINEFSVTHIALQGYFFKKIISNIYEFFLRNTPGHAGLTQFNGKPGQPVKLLFKRFDRLTNRPTRLAGLITGLVLSTLLEGHLRVVTPTDTFSGLAWGPTRPKMMRRLKGHFGCCEP